MPAQPDPNADDTAILPLTEGPPLVRPYVSAAVMEYEPEPMPAQDAFATTVMPPVGPPPMPAHPIVPQSRQAQAPWQAPDTPPMPAEPPVQEWTDEPGGDAHADLGVFAFHDEPGAAPAAGGRAERRAQQQAASSRRRWGVITGAGLGIVAVGAGLAFLLTPSQSNSKLDQALPLPSGTLPDPSASDDASPSSAPSGTASSSASASPSHVRTIKPSAPSKAPVAVITPSAAPTTAAPSAAPSPTSPRTLQYGDSGDDVRTMQQMLVTVYCGSVDQSLVTGTFDGQTQQVLAQFQRDAGIRGTERRTTTYGPTTRAALESYAQNPGC